MVFHRLIAELLTDLMFWVMTVEELHDVEPAFVYIEVDVPRLEVRRTGFPDERFRIQALDLLPRAVANAFTVRFGQYKENIQVLLWLPNLCALA